jgi:hypothetical protein
MILNQLPSFFGGCGQTKRMNGFFIVAHSADVFQPRQHPGGPLRQRGQSSL